MNATAERPAPEDHVPPERHANQGLVCEPMALSRLAMAAVPATQPASSATKPTFVTTRKIAPSRGERGGLAEASLLEAPMKAFHQECPCLVEGGGHLAHLGESVAPE